MLEQRAPHKGRRQNRDPNCLPPPYADVPAVSNLDTQFRKWRQRRLAPSSVAPTTVRPFEIGAAQIGGGEIGRRRSWARPQVGIVEGAPLRQNPHAPGMQSAILGAAGNPLPASAALLKSAGFAVVGCARNPISCSPSADIKGTAAQIGVSARPLRRAWRRATMPATIGAAEISPGLRFAPERLAANRSASAQPRRQPECRVRDFAPTSLARPEDCAASDRSLRGLPSFRSSRTHPGRVRCHSSCLRSRSWKGIGINRAAACRWIGRLR